jgi:hypothetical protein
MSSLESDCLPKKKRWLVSGAALALGVVALSGIAAFLYLKIIPAREAANPLASARLVPETAAFAAFVTTDSQTWAKLHQFGSPEARRLSQEYISRLTQSWQQELDYEKDLQPLIGSVMLAMLPPSAPDLSPEPRFLAVVAIKDKLAAWNFFNNHKDKLTGENLKNTDYRGIRLLEVTEPGQPSFYVGVLDNHLVVSPDQQIVKQAIDTFRGAPSLAQRQGAADLFTPKIALDNPVAQFYFPDYANFFQEMVSFLPGGSGLNQQMLNQSRQYQSLAVGVGIDQVGIRIRTLSRLHPGSPKLLPDKPFSGNVVSRFPAETIALFSGPSLRHLWSNVVEQGAAIPGFQVSLSQLRQGLRQSANLDLEQDLLGWMDRDFAVGIIPTQQGPLAQIGFGGALVIDTGDRPRAELTLNTLDTLVRRNGMSVQQRQLGGQPLTEWGMLGQGMLLGHGWLDQDTVFLGLGSSIVESMAARPTQTLKENQVFQAVSRTMPGSLSSYFYLDMNRVRILLYQNPAFVRSSLMAPEVEAILDSMQGIGFAASHPDPALQQGDIILAMTKNTE